MNSEAVAPGFWGSAQKEEVSIFWGLKGRMSVVSRMLVVPMALVFDTLAIASMCPSTSTTYLEAAGHFCQIVLDWVSTPLEASKLQNSPYLRIVP